MKSIEFTIKALPPSLNSIYGIKMNGEKRVYLKDHALAFKKLATMQTPFFKVDTDTKLHLAIRYYGNWFTKKGTIRKKDGQNLDKCLYDAIFDKLRVGDQQAFSGSWEKVQSMEEKTVVRISQHIGHDLPEDKESNRRKY